MEERSSSFFFSKKAGRYEHRLNSKKFALEVILQHISGSRSEESSTSKRDLMSYWLKIMNQGVWKQAQHCNNIQSFDFLLVLGVYISVIHSAYPWKFSARFPDLRFFYIVIYRSSSWSLKTSFHRAQSILRLAFCISETNRKQWVIDRFRWRDKTTRVP